MIKHLVITHIQYVVRYEVEYVIYVNRVIWKVHYPTSPYFLCVEGLQLPDRAKSSFLSPWSALSWTLLRNMHVKTACIKIQFVCAFCPCIYTQSEGRQSKECKGLSLLQLHFKTTRKGWSTEIAEERVWEVCGKKEGWVPSLTVPKALSSSETVSAGVTMETADSGNSGKNNVTIYSHRLKWIQNGLRE